MRSDAAIACCSVLNLSERSWSGWIEAAQQLKERRHHAHRERADADAMRARHEQHGERDRRQELDRREVQRVDRDRPEIRVEMSLVERREPFGLPRLAAEELHDAHARDPLLEVRVDAREPRADVAIRDAHARLEQVRREVDERDDGEGRDARAASR